MAPPQQMANRVADKPCGHACARHTSTSVLGSFAYREETVVRLDRAATKLLALVSTVGVISAITVTSAVPAGAATSTGPRSQAIVALAGDGAVSVPGLHVQSVLAGV